MTRSRGVQAFSIAATVLLCLQYVPVGPLANLALHAGCEFCTDRFCPVGGNHEDPEHAHRHHGGKDHQHDHPTAHAKDGHSPGDGVDAGPARQSRHHAASDGDENTISEQSRSVLADLKNPPTICTCGSSNLSGQFAPASAVRMNAPASLAITSIARYVGLADQYGDQHISSDLFRPPRIVA